MDNSQNIQNRFTLLARKIPLLACAFLLYPLALSGQVIGPWAPPEPFPEPRELRALSIEELADFTITSPARRPERIQDTPSAVSVVTGSTIHRSGATSIPESLRLATGVHVARANNNTWAVGIRGFNLTTTNKLLVLQDGRSLYSPLFGGAFWDVQDPMIEDIDRIEVIRGPGATMWGANAVNGVINITTRDAQETQGYLLSGGGGNRERGYGAARYGGQAGDHTWFRVYARGWERDDVVAADGRSIDESRRFAQGGFRIDSRPLPEVSWTLQGDLYDGWSDRSAGDPIETSGGNILGRWTHSSEPEREVSIQTYYDRVERKIPGTFAERRDTFDLQLQHRIPFGERHDVLWGGGANVSRDDIDNSSFLAFLPAKETLWVFSGFVQDKISLVPDRLSLTLGSKIEHNNYSGFEYQPSGRLSWMPTQRQTVWAALSRATRTPSRIDTDFHVFDPQTDELTIRGNPNFRSERLVASELGYRAQPHKSISLDLALFHHDYDRLRSLEGDDPTVIDNLLDARTYGLEFGATYQASDWWRIGGGYANLQRRVRARPESTDDPNARGAEGNDPQHIVFVHSALNLGDRWTLDGIVRHVSALPTPAVPSYTELDLRVAHQVTDDFEVSLAGRNLLESHHREFGTTHAVPRTVFFRIRWSR